jgi:hypothetical protein
MDEIFSPIEINLPLSISIAASFQRKLAILVQQLYGSCSQNHCNNNRIRPVNYRWRRLRSNRLSYVSAIAHQSGGKDRIWVAEINRLLTSIQDRDREDLVPQVRVISSWDRRNYLYWELNSRSVDTWLEHLSQSPFDRSIVKPEKQISIPSDPSLIIYARSRCASLKYLSHSIGMSIDRSRSLRFLARSTDLIFQQQSELKLIYALNLALDGLYDSAQPSRPQWGIDLAQAWLEYDRHCRIIGVDRELALARLELTTIVDRCLDRYSIDYWDINASIEL